MGGIARAMEENLCGHVAWLAARTDGMRVDDAADALAVDSGLASDTFNIVARADFAAARASLRVAEIVDGFAGRPFAWWVGPEERPVVAAALGARGLVAVEEEAGMALDLAALRPAPPPPGLAIRRVRDGAALAAFARVEAANWSPPDGAVLEYYRRVAPAALAPGAPLRFYLGVLDGEVAGGVELFLGGGVAGVYGAATLAGARRRGVCSALLSAALAEARADGVRGAVLQASSEGAGVYARLGFTPCGHFRQYAPR